MRLQPCMSEMEFTMDHTGLMYDGYGETSRPSPDKKTIWYLRTPWESNHAWMPVAQTSSAKSDRQTMGWWAYIARILHQSWVYGKRIIIICLRTHTAWIGGGKRAWWQSLYTSLRTGRNACICQRFWEYMTRRNDTTHFYQRQRLV